MTPTYARTVARAVPVKVGVSWWRALPVAALGAALMLAGLVAGAPGTPPSCAGPAAITDTDLVRVLATIRFLESGSNYAAQAAGSTASGAYQFIDATWAHYAGYPRAVDAPPDVQDAKASEHINQILTATGGRIDQIPVVWYLGHPLTDNSPEWDLIPAPAAGNTLTPRQYQQRWLDAYQNPNLPLGNGGGVVGEGCAGALGGTWQVPAGVDQLVASQISWGGYVNGQIPYEAMRYRPHSGYLHPAASAAYDQLYAAALTDGIQLDGWGYRPASVGGHTAGNSNHGWALAIDINPLVVGTTYPTDATAFTSPEYQWLQANAATYGWINPTWARPVTLGGTGKGGWVGDNCCHLEPWHWEWAAFMNVAVS